MADTTKHKDDALIRRARRVAELVDELRSEAASLRTELAHARERILRLEKAQGTVRQRVERMLQSAGGAA